MKLDKKLFLELYLEEKLPTAEIAKRTGCSRGHLVWLRRKWNIPERKRERYRDLTGMVFNRWTVLHAIRRKDKVLWRCRCQCGREATLQGTSLIQETSTQCYKCGHPPAAIFCPLPNFYWKKILNGAKRRGLDVTVSQDYCRELYEKQERKCALTGVDLHFGKTREEFDSRLNTASLDRIDSSLGYVEGNIQWVHKVVNLMKRTLGQEEFRDWCRKVADHERFCLGREDANCGEDRRQSN